MSVIRTVNLWCDDPDCADADAYSSGSNSFNTVAAIRADARRGGWKHKNGKDYCPDHGDQQA